MFSGLNMNRLVGGSKAGPASKKNAGGGKRKAEVSPRKMEPNVKKRSALGDLTNAVKRKGTSKDKAEKEDQSGPLKVMTRARSKSLVTGGIETTSLMQPVLALVDINVQNKKDKPSNVEENSLESKLPVRQKRASRSRISEGHVPVASALQDETENEKPRRLTRMSTRSSMPPPRASSTPKDLADDVEGSLYETAISSPDTETEIILYSQDVDEQNRKNEEISIELRSKLPHGVIDFDAETANDPFQVGLYAEDIFSYYRRREGRFPIRKYLDKQTELNRNMRSILVDWMVEVQESFELNHETLYLAVKLVDLFLSKVQVKREKLQLVGTTAVYVAAKYDERCPPIIDDFCYICDDAYPQKDVIRMEMKVLRVLDFDIGVPLSYRFLRRFSRCAKLDMDTLTLARYILEMSLMEYDFIDVRDSMMASAALLLALVMKDVKTPWSPTLRYYTGYSVEDLFDITHRLHAYLLDIPANLKTIRSKYSHKVFYEAAKVPLPDELKL